MNEAYGEILTVEETARYLKIPASTVYRLAQQRRMPACKVGRQWRFRKEAIDRWLEVVPASNLEKEVSASLP